MDQAGGTENLTASLRERAQAGLNPNCGGGEESRGGHAAGRERGRGSGDGKEIEGGDQETGKRRMCRTFHREGRRGEYARRSTDGASCCLPAFDGARNLWSYMDIDS